MTSRVRRALEPTGYTGVALWMFIPCAGFVASRDGAQDGEGR